jgi:hypothetical protein
MKLTRLPAYTLGLILSLVSIAHAQSGGVGGSQSGGTQTFPGQNPAPSTQSTPAAAAATGTAPGTAPAPTPGAAATATGTAAPAAGATTDNGGTMSTIVVSGTVEGSVLPTEQTVTSVLGADISVQDTPRTVTVVSSELLSDANISSLADFVKVAPSAYTTDQFGVASVPNIRGQNAEVYINGMLRTTRSDGPPTSFNSVEQADVVAGPATVYLGPTANTGGYVNLVTKQPFFDTFHDDTEFTFGSYAEKIWTEDFGGPIIKNVLAYRASYQGDYSGSYYENEKTESNDGYIALGWTPNKDFRVDFNSEIYDGRFNENTGLNRPTQGLIDGLNYSTGGTTAFGGTYVNGTGVAGPAPTTNPGTFAGIIDSPGTQKISASDTLVSPEDADFSKDINAELMETYNLNDNITLINHTYYEYFELRNSEFAQLYVNLPTSNILQDRAEAHIDFDLPIGGGTKVDAASTDAKDGTDGKDMKHMSQVEAPLVFKNEIITGVAFKYVNAIAYGDFFNEYLNATDLTSQNYVETAYEASAFYQHQITFTPEWMLIYGARADTIFDRLRDPLADEGDGTYPNDYDTTIQVEPTADASIDYKPATWVTLYGTFDFNESSPGNSAGGFDTFSNGGQAADYHYKNYLYEIGAKFNLLDNKLYTAIDGYYQTHNATDAFGDTTTIRTLGAEISTTYQPSKDFYMEFNESYLDAIVVDPGAQFTENVYDTFSTNSVGVSGTGVGSPNFIPEPPGHYRESGLPQMIFAGTANYKLPYGFTVSAGYTITDPIPTSEAENVWIPWQYEIDASLAYKYKDFFAKATFYNITDQTNFSTGGYLEGGGNDLITVKEPFHMEGTVGYKF